MGSPDLDLPVEFIPQAVKVIGVTPIFLGSRVISTRRYTSTRLRLASKG